MCREKEQVQEMTKTDRTLRAVLLFYAPGPWTTAKLNEWDGLTGCREATTKNLCDLVREALSEAEVGKQGGLVFTGVERGGGEKIS